MKITLKQYAKFLLETRESSQKEQVLLIKGLADFIRSNRDIRKLDQISLFFQELVDQKESIKRIEVISRGKLEEEKIEKLKIFFAKRFLTDKKKLIVNNCIKPEIMGGIIIKIGNEIWDGSIFSKINRIKQAIG